MNNLDANEAKVLIIATSGIENPKQCPAPFLFALEAAAKGAEVSICFVAQGPIMLKQGAADTVYPKEDQRPLINLIKATLDAGVKFQVCGAALELNGMTPDDLIEEVEELVGPSFLITRGLEVDLVLSF